jgi:hypothetical protein
VPSYLKLSVQSKSHGEHLALTLGVATWMLGSAHPHMVMTYAKLFKKKFSGMKCTYEHLTKL